MAVDIIARALGGNALGQTSKIDEKIVEKLEELGFVTLLYTDDEHAATDENGNPIAYDVAAFVRIDEKGAPNGVATLDANGKVPEGQLPGGGGGVTSVNEKTGDVVLTPADLGIGTVFQLKGSKATAADLPASDNVIGDVWYVVAESVGYIWLNDGTDDRWEQLGLPVDLSNYYTKTQTDAAIAAAIGNAIGGAY